MSHPICASDCIAIITAEDPCDLQVKCLCTSTIYISAYRDCVYLYCDAADILAWGAYAESKCSAAGVESSTFQATATQGSVPQSTSVIYQTSVLTADAGTATGFPDATTFISITSTASAQPVTSNTPASAPTTQNSNGGLGVGAIVGIAIGAIAAVLLAILIAFLLWRRRRKQLSALPPESAPVQKLGANNQRPDIERDVKPMTTTSVVFTPELSTEQAVYAASYEKKPVVQEITSDPRYPSHQLSPIEPNSVHQFSPSSANSELAAVVPSEVAASTRAISEYGPPYHDVSEVDSTRHSHITSPVSELGNPPSEIQHELSASPYMTSYSPGTGQSGSAARELSSSPAPQAAVPFSELHALATTGGAIAGPVDDDAELNRMKAEIEAVRAEKERVLHLQALEERERELSRKIVNRELSKGVGS